MYWLRRERLEITTLFVSSPLIAGSRASKNFSSRPNPPCVSSLARCRIKKTRLVRGVGHLIAWVKRLEVTFNWPSPPFCTKGAPFDHKLHEFRQEGADDRNLPGHLVGYRIPEHARHNPSVRPDGLFRVVSLVPMQDAPPKSSSTALSRWVPSRPPIGGFSGRSGVASS